MGNSRERFASWKSDYMDYSLVAVVIILVCFGLIMLYSASSYESTIMNEGDDAFYLKHQAILTLVGLGFAFAISKINYRVFVKLGPIVFALSIVLMFLVLTPLGLEVNGARRWIVVAGVQFQPAEFAKIGVILFTVYEIMKRRKLFLGYIGTGLVLLIGLIGFLCAYRITDNLSTGIIIFGICFIMTFVAHPKTKRFVFLMLMIVAIVIVILYVNLYKVDGSDHFRLRRVLAWMDPEKYSDLGGFQVLQGLYAIGSGGFFGVGLGNSSQKLATIPEAQNDMIFSIICEELGLFGAIIVIVLFIYLLYRLFWIAQNAADIQGTLIVTGVFAHISLQVILNICVVLNVIPTTGVTLPFFSYGGTSIILLLVEIGLVLGVSSKIEVSHRGRIKRRNLSIDRKNEKTIDFMRAKRQTGK